MARYCITAAKHANPQNHVASKFLLWCWVAEEETWRKEKQPATARQIVELIETRYQVFTARENPKTITVGKPVEVELRIAKNETEFPISEMPEF